MQSLQVDLILRARTYFNSNKYLMTSSKTISQIDTPVDSLDIQKYLPFIGVLRCQWESSPGIISTITYGTAILISSRVIMTCTHNLFSQRLGRPCDTAFFIPGVDGEELLSSKKYFIRNQKSVKFKNGETFRFKPSVEELSILLLTQPFQNPLHIKYPKIGVSQLSAGASLSMAGYPSKSYYSRFSMADVCPSRTVASGILHSCKENVINHTMKTSIGMSGGAIFAKNEAQEYFICGIHTHRGLEQGYNSGLYFTSEVVRKLQDFFAELKRQNNLQNDTLHLLGNEVKDIADREFSRKDDEQYENESEISCYNDLLNREEDFPRDIDFRNSSEGEIKASETL